MASQRILPIPGILEAITIHPQSIRTAVIPAAGLGTRFLPATRAVPKEMLPLVDRPVIEYSVEEAVEAGIDDFLIVTNRFKASIEDHFDTKQELEKALSDRGMPLIPFSHIHLHYVRQPQPRGLGHAVSLAAAHIQQNPFVVLLPDDVLPGTSVGFSSHCLRDMIRIYQETGRPVVAVRPVEPALVRLYGVVDVRRGHNFCHDVIDLVEKPAPSEAPSNLAILGRYVLPSEIFAILEAATPGAGGEIQLTDALRTLNRQMPIVAYECRDTLYDVGSKLGYLQAMVELTLRREDLGPPFLSYLRDLLGVDALERRE